MTKSLWRGWRQVDSGNHYCYFLFLLFSLFLFLSILRLVITFKMGISGLAKVIADNAPQAIRKEEIKSYFGRKVAIDASMSIYQFLIAVRSEGQMLQNDEGETTSHLMGIFYRTIRMVEYGIKPLYVFDGKPPQLKSKELSKRLERRETAVKGMAEAKETGDQESFDKHSRRIVKVTAQHNQECKRLLTLMGIPYINAPCEAEAQCAELCRTGKVFASASEDMDTLTFNSSILLRHLTFSEARKMPIDEIHLEKVLQGLELTMDEFIDLCILLGCDYCDSIRGIGPHRALTLIRQHKSIEKVLENLDRTKYPIPEDWPYQASRELFKKPNVLAGDTIDVSGGVIYLFIFHKATPFLPHSLIHLTYFPSLPPIDLYSSSGMNRIWRESSR